MHTYEKGYALKMLFCDLFDNKKAHLPFNDKTQLRLYSSKDLNQGQLKLGRDNSQVRNQIQSSEEMIPIITHISNTIKCNTKDLFICMYYLTNDDQYETKTKEMPEDGRPNTPDDMLNISQTEITVL